MSENRLTKREKWQRIAAASAIDSLDIPMGCLPLTVAFTHGYSQKEYNIGLKPEASVQNVRDASKILADLHDETVTENRFLLDSVETTNNFIEGILSNSRAVWLTYTANMSHILGVLKEGDDKYLVCDNAKLDKISTLTSKEISERIVKANRAKQVESHIFAFTVKD